jgi:hypothetical protein
MHIGSSAPIRSQEFAPPRPGRRPPGSAWALPRPGGTTAAVALLAARSPTLRNARKVEPAHLILDGTLIPIDRVAADRPFYSGKHRRHGMNLQVISGPHGEIVWVSGPLPGSVHDLTAARTWDILRELAAAGLVVLADKGYHGAGDRETRG